MANEITCTDTINVNNGEVVNRSLNVSQKRIDQAAQGYQSGTVALSNTPSLVPMDDLTTPGRYVFKNLEDAGGESIQVGLMVSAVFYPLDEIEPGEASSGRVPAGVSIYAQTTSSGATASLEFFVAED